MVKGKRRGMHTISGPAGGVDGDDQLMRNGFTAGPSGGGAGADQLKRTGPITGPSGCGVGGVRFCVSHT